MKSSWIKYSTKTRIWAIFKSKNTTHSLIAIWKPQCEGNCLGKGEIEGKNKLIRAYFDVKNANYWAFEKHKTLYDCQSPKTRVKLTFCIREALLVCCLELDRPLADPPERRWGCNELLTVSDAGGVKVSGGAIWRLESLHSLLPPNTAVFIFSLANTDNGAVSAHENQEKAGVKREFSSHMRHLC